MFLLFYGCFSFFFLGFSWFLWFFCCFFMFVIFIVFVNCNCEFDMSQTHKVAGWVFLIFLCFCKFFFCCLRFCCSGWGWAGRVHDVPDRADGVVGYNRAGELVDPNDGSGGWVWEGQPTMGKYEIKNVENDNVLGLNECVTFQSDAPPSSIDDSSGHGARWVRGRVEVVFHGCASRSVVSSFVCVVFQRLHLVQGQAESADPKSWRIARLHWRP